MSQPLWIQPTPAQADDFLQLHYQNQNQNMTQQMGNRSTQMATYGAQPPNKKKFQSRWGQGMGSSGSL